MVSHLAQEPLPTNQMPRTITVFLSAPPGDGLRTAREHFHEYVKPILVAGALDWEVIEGRKEGEVRSGLATKIRRLRRRNGEAGQTEDTEESAEDRLEGFRRGAQIRSWDGVQGDLILGRHTWKEYIRGMHEGWLGPLDDPHKAEPPLSETTTPLAESPAVPTASTETHAMSLLEEAQSKTRRIQDETKERPEPTQDASDPAPPPENSVGKPPPKPSPPPPYLKPASYSTSPLSISTPSPLPPSMALPFPHLLGFLNTPIRIYRFLTRRYLTDCTGQLVATLVLASNTRGYQRGQEFVSNTNIDEDASVPTRPTEVVEAQTAWEQESVLVDEENEWHKSAWKPSGEDDPDRERPWKEHMVMDERIAGRMRTFELSAEERDDRLGRGEAEMRVEAREQGGLFRRLSKWLGFHKDEGMKGWEMGLVESEEGRLEGVKEPVVINQAQE